MGNRKSKKQDGADCNNSGWALRQPDGHDWPDGASKCTDRCATKIEAEEKPTKCSRLKRAFGASLSPAHHQKNPSPSKAEENGAFDSSICRHTNSPTMNETVIESTRVEVANLLEGINTFQGVSQDDKHYRYYDEMLTRCMLDLDQIECESSEDRSGRREAILGVNQAITLLERKLEINREIKDLEQDLNTL